MTKNIYHCNHCDKMFDNQKSLNIHLGYVNSEKTQKLECPTCNKEIIKFHFENHLNNRKKCLECGKLFCRYGNEYKFCSNSCAATYNNKGRKQSPETKEKISKSLSKKSKKSLLPKNNIAGPYTKIFKNKCAHCESIFYKRQQTKYCDNDWHLYRHKNRNRYKFTFDPKSRPDLFDINLIEKIGYYSPRTNKNKNGLTMDHKISVNEAIKNNYDPYYIKHPLNCEIMPFSKNNKKKTNSSITYEKLVKIVNEDDQKNKRGY